MRSFDSDSCHPHEEQDQFLLLALLSVVTLFGLFVVLYPQTVMFRTYDEQRAQSHVIKTLQDDLVKSETKHKLALMASERNNSGFIHMLAGVDSQSSREHPK